MLLLAGRKRKAKPLITLTTSPFNGIYLKINSKKKNEANNNSNNN